MARGWMVLFGILIAAVGAISYVAGVAAVADVDACEGDFSCSIGTTDEEVQAERAFGATMTTAGGWAAVAGGVLFLFGLFLTSHKEMERLAKLRAEDRTPQEWMLPYNDAENQEEAPAGDEAIAELRMRFARGEVDEPEYERRLVILSRDDHKIRGNGDRESIAHRAQDR